MTSTASPGKLAAFGEALDVADRLIERAYGMDVPDEWNAAFKAVQDAEALATPDGEGREVLARIIDPIGWEMQDALGEMQTRLNGFDTSYSLSKADACLAALASRGGGVAQEVALLQEALRRYGDRIGMANAPPHLQCEIDRAMLAASPAPLAPDLGGEAVAPEVVERVRADIDRLEADAGVAAHFGTPSAAEHKLRARGDPPIRWNSGMAADLRALLASRAPGLSGPVQAGQGSGDAG